MFPLCQLSKLISVVNHYSICINIFETSSREYQCCLVPEPVVIFVRHLTTSCCPFWYRYTSVCHQNADSGGEYHQTERYNQTRNHHHGIELHVLLASSPQNARIFKPKTRFTRTTVTSQPTACSLRICSMSLSLAGNQPSLRYSRSSSAFCMRKERRQRCQMKSSSTSLTVEQSKAREGHGWRVTIDRGRRSSGESGFD